MRPLRRSAPVLAVAAVALLPSCGGGRDDPPSGLTPDQVLERAVTASTELRRYRVSGTANVQASLTGGRVPDLVRQALGPGVSLRGAGRVDEGSAAVEIGVALAGLPALQADVTKAGGRLLADVLGTAYRVDLPPGRVAAVVPARLAEALLRRMANPRDAGREDIDGVATVRLSGIVDAERAGRDLTAALRALGATGRAQRTEAAARQLERGLRTRSIEAWIGARDRLPRRVTARLSFAGRLDAVPELRSATIDLDLRFTHLGVAAPIVVPEATEVLDLRRLRSLAGG